MMRSSDVVIWRDANVHIVLDEQMLHSYQYHLDFK
jgi:hypothetical protein